MLTKEREYEIFLDHVDKMTDRRPGITTTYMSVNTAIVGLLAVVLASKELDAQGRVFILFALSLSGIIACNLWRKLVSEYEILLNWWYLQLRSIESELSEGSGLLNKEYSELYVVSSKRAGMTKYEIGLTRLFIFLYGIVIIINVLFWLL